MRIYGAPGWLSGVKCLTLDGGSVHDLRVRRLSLESGSQALCWAGIKILSLRLSLPPPFQVLSLSKKNIFVIPYFTKEIYIFKENVKSGL